MGDAGLTTFDHTRRACYAGYVTQAIVNNLAPLLFIVFQTRYQVPYEMLGRLVLLNFATQLITDHALMIGGTAIPAGTYTLWTLPSASGAQLIINKQHGQWGTEYDPAQDLVRLPLTQSALATPVEQFTIALDPSGTTGGTLRLRWAGTEYSIPFTIQ